MDAKTTLAALIRHGLTVLTGYLITKGTISGNTAEALLALVPGVAAIIWSFLNKWKVTRQIAVALSLNPSTDSTVVEQKLKTA